MQDTTNKTSNIQWTPPVRPEWVERINEEGDYMVNEVVPLDERSLIDSAIRNTGGLTDFGADDWREPFQVLIKSMEEEADLNFMGRIRIRSEILMMLEARLRIEDTYKRHPEIEDEQITQPIMVCGQGRSGTSFLINVLASNPDNGALLHWEQLFPCPPPEKASYKTDPRIERAEKIVKQWHRVTPTMDSIHEWSGHLPHEDCGIFAINFMATTSFCVFGQAASYEDYMAKMDPEPAFHYHKRVLKLLQWKNPRQHWVLKDVPHLHRLETLMKVYPDARIVWPHRDPVKALSSAISTLGTEWWAGSDLPYNGTGTLEYACDPKVSAAAFERVINQLEAGVVPPNQIYHMMYKDLVTDTTATLETMYDHLGLELSDNGREAMAKYLADHPRNARPAHKTNVSLSPDELTKARQAYKAYQEYFGITNE